jgi:hypothetical protein
MRLTTGQGAALNEVPLSRREIALAREVWSLSGERWAAPGTSRMLIRACAIRLFPIPEPREQANAFTPATTCSYVVRINASDFLGLSFSERLAKMDEVLETARLELDKELHRIDTAGMREAFAERETL